MPIIKDRRIVEDAWTQVPPDVVALPAGDIIVPLAVWKSRKEELSARNGGLGLRLEPGEHPGEIVDDLPRFSMIALNFPNFRDGRAYSYARLLRERYGFKGEIRAVGDVGRDQMFFMARCGINAFEVKSGKSIEDALAALSDFSVTYQNAADTPLPVFRR